MLILKGLDTITHDQAVRKAFCVILYFPWVLVKSMLWNSNYWSQLKQVAFNNNYEDEFLLVTKLTISTVGGGGGGGHLRDL